MISPSKIALIISEDIDEMVSPEDYRQRAEQREGHAVRSHEESIQKIISQVGKDVPIDGMTVMQDTFEEIEIGPHSINIESDVAYDYQEGEPMVRYYSDGSGHPGSPGGLNAYLAGINEIDVVDSADVFERFLSLGVLKGLTRLFKLKLAGFKAVA